MAITKRAFLDFEFNQTSEAKLNLVCCSIITNDGQRYDEWLHNSPEGYVKCKNKIHSLDDDGYEFIAYAVTAEARAFLAMDIYPVDFKWVDLYLEYRMLLNQNNHMAYGKQLIHGKEVITRRPTYDRIDKVNYSKPEYGMAAACYKLLGIKIDTDHKTKMRDLIISNPDTFSEEDKKSIMEYCHSDVKYLPKLYNAMLREHHRLLNKANIPWDSERNRIDRYKRAEYAARTAIMESIGYPIDVQATENFIKNVPQIIRSCVEDILAQELPIKPFKWNKRLGRYSECQKELKQFIQEHYVDGEGRNWRRTDKDAISLSLDAFSDHSSSRHDFRRNNLIDQMLRYKKLMQHLNGFRPKAPTAKNKKVFKDSLGSDGRVRPYFGIYGAQSSRSQPSSTGFIPLKAAWMRSLIMPPKGRLCCGIDYGSQEFLLSAIISGDRRMFEAYVSGDPYLYFAKAAGAVPPDGTKKSHAKERNLFKSTTLGISYNMGKVGLAHKLTDDTGELVTPDEAQTLIDKFFGVYTEFAKWNDTNKFNYEIGNPIVLPCGWTMWGDNDNWRSVNNVPIQGLGASIMRKAVELAQDRGLDVIYTLHDAVYIEFDFEDAERSIQLLERSMREACMWYFKGEQQQWASRIRLDADVWGSGATSLNIQFVKTQERYIDERSVKEYEFFKEYL